MQSWQKSIKLLQSMNYVNRLTNPYLELQVSQTIDLITLAMKQKMIVIGPGKIIVTVFNSKQNGTKLTCKSTENLPLPWLVPALCAWPPRARRRLTPLCRVVCRLASRLHPARTHATRPDRTVLECLAPRTCDLSPRLTCPFTSVVTVVASAAHPIQRPGHQ